MSSVKRLIGMLFTVCLCITASFAVETTESAMEQEKATGYLSSYAEAISREEFCYLVISLMAEMKESSVDELYEKLTDKQKNESFGDVNADNPYIALAKKYELVVGKNEQVFSPDEAIKRQEVAAILLNLVMQVAPEYYDDSVDYAQDITIEDHVEISKWGRDAVDFLLGISLMKTDQNGNFDPTASITVEEAVILISGMRVYLSTPLPAEEIEEDRIPTYAWVAGGALVGVVLLVATILLLRRRNSKRRADKLEREQLLENALNLRLSPENKGAGGEKAPVAEPGEKKISPRPARAVSQENVTPKQIETPRPAILTPKPAKVQSSAMGEGTVCIGEVEIPSLHIFGVQGTEMDRVLDLCTPVSIGRTEDNRLCLPYSTVSRAHCRIRWDGLRILVENSSTTNPTCVLREGAKLIVQENAPLPLSGGDILELGSLRLKIELRKENCV